MDPVRARREFLMQYFSDEYYKEFYRERTDEELDDAEEEEGCVVPLDKILLVPSDMVEVIEPYDPNSGYSSTHSLLYKVLGKYLLFQADYGSCGMCGHSILYLVFKKMHPERDDDDYDYDDKDNDDITDDDSEAESTALREVIEEIIDNMMVFDTYDDYLKHAQLAQKRDDAYSRQVLEEAFNVENM